LRALREQERPTFSRLAAASGLNDSTIRHRALVDNWKKLGRGGEAGRSARPGETALLEMISAGPSEDLLPRVGDFLARQIERLVAAIEVQGDLMDKAGIDRLSSMIRMLEHSGTLASERATDRDTDDDIAALHKRVDDRIVELARGLAERLVAGQSDG
jgi:hypothetical protein